MDAFNDPTLLFWRSFGDWGFELVIWGVIGEVLAATIDFISEKRCKTWHRHWKRALRLAELLSGGILVFGLAMEYRGHKKETLVLDSYNAKSYERAADAEKDAGVATNIAAQAIEKAAKFDLARAIAEQQTAIIQSNNLVLQKELQQRVIAKADITNFIFLTEKIPKISISIGTGEVRDETFNYAHQLRYMFDLAKFGTPVYQTNLPERVDVHEGLLFWDTLPEATDKWDDVTLVYNASTNPFNYSFHYEFTNGFSRPIISEKEVGDTNVIYSALAFCLSQIRINVNSEQSVWMASNQCEFIIRQKSQ